PAFGAFGPSRAMTLLGRRATEHRLRSAVARMDPALDAGEIRERPPRIALRSMRATGCARIAFRFTCQIARADNATLPGPNGCRATLIPVFVPARGAERRRRYGSSMNPRFRTEVCILV